MRSYILQKDCVPLYDMKEQAGVDYPGHQSLWLNKNISIEEKCIFWKEWYEKGITFVSEWELTVLTVGYIQN